MCTLESLVIQTVKACDNKRCRGVEKYKVGGNLQNVACVLHDFDNLFPLPERIRIEKYNSMDQ